MCAILSSRSLLETTVHKLLLYKSRWVAQRKMHKHDAVVVPAKAPSKAKARNPTVVLPAGVSASANASNVVSESKLVQSESSDQPKSESKLVQGESSDQPKKEGSNKINASIPVLGKAFANGFAKFRCRARGEGSFPGCHFRCGFHGGGEEGAGRAAGIVVGV